MPKGIITEATRASRRAMARDHETRLAAEWGESLGVEITVYPRGGTYLVFVTDTRRAVRDTFFVGGLEAAEGFCEGMRIVRDEIRRDRNEHEGNMVQALDGLLESGVGG